VAPGWIDGPALRANAAAGRIDVAAIESRIPMGRLVGAADVAKLVRFLGSDEAEHITGQVIYVDGGMSAALDVW
jgi:NAD(P)-dependent dehydrogenase (short-subunit alcohol dehydrogenase family)